MRKNWMFGRALASAAAAAAAASSTVANMAGILECHVLDDVLHATVASRAGRPIR